MKETSICAVTKKRSIKEIEEVLSTHPEIKDIAENRWPDLKETFKHFSNYTRHFIGPIQSNKLRNIIFFVDVIQSVDHIKYLKTINQYAEQYGKTIKFCFQVNISHDAQKRGLMPDHIAEAIEHYLSSNYSNLQLIGLMTIGAQVSLEEREVYFKHFKQLFDHINQKYFPDSPLPVLSMGMTDDYREAIKAGSTMVRLGRALFNNQ